jgi:hypothetical protein
VVRESLQDMRQFVRQHMASSDPSSGFDTGACNRSTNTWIDHFSFTPMPA